MWLVQKQSDQIYETQQSSLFYDKGITKGVMMKPSVALIASLLAMMLTGCGDEKRVSELEDQVKKAQANISTLSSSIQTAVFEKDLLSEIHESQSYKIHPEKNDVPGYELALETLVGQHVIAARIRGEEKINNATQDIVAPLYWLEERWPDRLSTNGIKIGEGLWWCRDTATITRLAMEAVSTKQIADAKYFAIVAKNAIEKCTLALIAAQME